MNPIRRKEELGIRWFFTADDVSGKEAASGSVLYSPSGQGFTVESVSDGKIEARSGTFKLTGRDNPSSWNRVFLDESEASQAIVASILDEIGSAQRAIYSADWTGLTEKSRLIRELEEAKVPSLKQALDLDKRYRKLVGVPPALPAPPLTKKLPAPSEKLVENINYDPAPGNYGTGDDNGKGTALWLIGALGLVLTWVWLDSE